MSNTIRTAAALSLLVILVSGCACLKCKPGTVATDVGGKDFAADVAFLEKHTDVVVLQDAGGNARVAVVPAYQGRVMTSAATGPQGRSFGWMNYDLIASGKIQPHINAYGGEDRFWMGPEGGQYAIFFAPGASFTLKDWQTPAMIDTEPFDVVSRDAGQATFRKQASLTNMSGTQLDIQVDRTVRLLDAAAAKKLLGVEVTAPVSMVAYETDNKLTNTGKTAWQKESGLLSIWILGMFKPGPQTTVVIPFREGPEDKLGPRVNDTYFGKVPADRLVVKDSVLFFSGDGQYRSKIGISPQRAMPVCGSYDEAAGVLTIVQYTLPFGVTDYVNSMWELQEKPFGGDTVNSYNDGPPAPGKKPLGPFYELESSSPALALAPNASASHVHRTFHFQGPEEALAPLAQVALGVSLADIKAAF